MNSSAGWMMIEEGNGTYWVAARHNQMTADTVVEAVGTDRLVVANCVADRRQAGEMEHWQDAVAASTANPSDTQLN